MEWGVDGKKRAHRSNRLSRAATRKLATARQPSDECRSKSNFAPLAPLALLNLLGVGLLINDNLGISEPTHSMPIHRMT